MMNNDAELRRDPVTNEWILLSPKRRERPHGEKRTKPPKSSVRSCPFEDPQRSGNGAPLLWFMDPSMRKRGDEADLQDWFLQVIRNKYPAIGPHVGTCPVAIYEGIESMLSGIGFHEVIVTKPHNRTIANMKIDEVELIIRAYQERYHALLAESCLEYILILHNSGAEAGASLEHPHSQLIALPVIPADVNSSFEGSRKYYKKNERCVHCDVILWERRKKIRILAENKEFIAFAPYASHANYELRIYPKKHSARFETIATQHRPLLAELLITCLKSLGRALKNPAYNFFIHTAPLHERSMQHYHWHLEIFPKTETMGGLELGAGMEIISIAPEEVARKLSRFIK